MNNIITIYALISFITILSCAKISYKLGLIDIPNKRKIHKKDTAFTGGLGISISLVLSILIFDIFNNPLNYILSIAFLIALLGLLDDKYDLNVGGKLSLQIIPIFYLIVINNLYLENLGNYAYFKVELGAFQIPFTLLCVLFLINSFNYFDGTDGTLSFTTISVISILYFLVPIEEFRFFLIIILIPISIFLFFNFSLFKLPKLFLGDSGSLLLGFIISFLLIYLANKNLAHPILLAWSIAIFVYEFLSLNFIRIKKKRNLFKAAKDHLHHIIFNLTNSIFLTNFSIFLINVFLFIMGYLSFLLISPLISFILFFLLFFVFLILRSILEKKIKNVTKK